MVVVSFSLGLQRTFRSHVDKSIVQGGHWVIVDLKMHRGTACERYMEAVTLSYAQALRVIGQDLVPLGISSFELAKLGDDYVVWMKQGEFVRDLSAKKTFFEKITQKILGRVDSDRKVLNRMHFSNSNIFSANLERTSKRRISDSPKDLRDLSFVLRVLGDYLDRKAPQDFTISLSMDTIKIRYDHKDESFTLQNLYDFGINMYLKRSNRRP